MQNAYLERKLLESGPIKSLHLSEMKVVSEPMIARWGRDSASSIFALIQAGRLHNSLALASVGLVGYMYQGVSQGLMVCLLGWTSVFLGIYFFNDYFDSSIDVFNKPWKPVPSGRVTEKQLKIAGAISFVFGLLSVVTGSVKIGLPPVVAALTVLSVATLGFEYSRWIKRTRPFVGNVVISIVVGLCFLLPLFSIDRVPFEYILSLPVYTIGLLGREYLKDLEDLEADRRGGRCTLPLRFGRDFSVWVIGVLLVLTLAWCLVISTSNLGSSHKGYILFTLFISLSLNALLRGDVSKSQGWLKPGLLFFLLSDLVHWSAYS